MSRRSPLAGPRGRARKLLACTIVLFAVSTHSAPSTSVAPGPANQNGSRARLMTAAPTLRAVDGGRRYFERFTNSLPSSSSFFPIGVWFESVTSRDDTVMDKAAGLNTYVELTANSSLAIVNAADMHALPSWAPRSSRTDGYLLADEVDMWAGPGSALWTGNFPGQGQICEPDGVGCGYTVQRRLRRRAPQGRMTMANYGKGVTFWETNREAAGFVNGLQDLVSADNYWFTDPNICGSSEGGSFLGKSRPLTSRECRLAANYGRTVSRVRSLVSPRRTMPVWGFVEVGHPASEDWTPTINGTQIRAAVWSSIIHGARGIVYFNHSFGGGCISQHVLRDSCGSKVRPAVTRVNQQVRRLATVINAPFVDHLVVTSSAVDVATKLHRGHFYVLAGSRQDVDQTARLHFRCGLPRSARVLGENRTLRIRNGRLDDRFRNGNAVHIYRIDGGTTCGLGG
jgi:hypothetical protein